MKAFVTGIKYRRTSKNGNPQFVVTFAGGDQALTEIDNALNYRLSENYQGLVTVRLNERHQIIEFTELDPRKT